MSSSDYLPGTHMVIKEYALVRRYGSEEEHYTQRMQNGIVLQLAYLWQEGQETSQPTYLVLFSNDMRIYLVAARDLLTPDQAVDPSRLFGRLFSGPFGGPLG